MLNSQRQVVRSPTRTVGLLQQREAIVVVGHPPLHEFLDTTAQAALVTGPFDQGGGHGRVTPMRIVDGHLAGRFVHEGQQIGVVHERRTAGSQDAR